MLLPGLLCSLAGMAGGISAVKRLALSLALIKPARVSVRSSLCAVLLFVLYSFGVFQVAEALETQNVFRLWAAACAKSYALVTLCFWKHFFFTVQKQAAPWKREKCVHVTCIAALTISYTVFLYACSVPLWVTACVLAAGGGGFLAVYMKKKPFMPGREQNGTRFIS